MRALIIKEIKVLKNEYLKDYSLLISFLILLAVYFFINCTSLFLLTVCFFNAMFIVSLILNKDECKFITSMPCTRGSYVKFKFIYGFIYTLVTMFISLFFEFIVYITLKKDIITLVQLEYIFAALVLLLGFNILISLTNKDKLFTLSLVITFCSEFILNFVVNPFKDILFMINNVVLAQMLVVISIIIYFIFMFFSIKIFKNIDL